MQDRYPGVPNRRQRIEDRTIELFANIASFSLSVANIDSLYKFGRKVLMKPFGRNFGGAPRLQVYLFHSRFIADTHSAFGLVRIDSPPKPNLTLT